jgi:uncharacterized protein
MLFRAFRAAALAALAFHVVPAAAQQFSDSHEFLDAVRKSDGAKVDKYLRDESLGIVNTKDRTTGEAALHIAAARSDALYVRVLLQANNVNANIQDRGGNTPLIVATRQDWAEGVGILIKYHANVNLANSRGETPLILAVQLHNAEIVRQLLAAGADPDRADYQAGKSARDYARDFNRYPNIAKMLTDAPKKGANGAAGPKL